MLGQGQRMVPIAALNPLIADAEIPGVHQALRNFLAVLVADMNALPNIQDIPGKSSAVAQRGVLKNLQAGLDRLAVPAPNTLRHKEILSALLVNINRIHGRVDPRVMVDLIADYLTELGQPIDKDSFYWLLSSFAITKGAQVNNKPMEAGSNPPADFTARTVQDFFMGLGLPSLKVALSSGNHNNCGLHGIIHTYMYEVLNLSSDQLREEMQAYPLLKEMVETFFATNPFFQKYQHLQGNLDAFLAYNRYHSSPADREVLWGDLLRKIYQKNRAEWAQVAYNEYVQGAAPALGLEAAKEEAQRAMAILLNAGNDGDFMDAQALGQITKRLGRRLMIIDIRDPSGMGNEVINAQGITKGTIYLGKSPAHYDFLLADPAAIAEHNKQMRASIDIGLSAIERRLGSMAAPTEAIEEQILEQHKRIRAKGLFLEESQQEITELLANIEVNNTGFAEVRANPVKAEAEAKQLGLPLAVLLNNMQKSLDEDNARLVILLPQVTAEEKELKALEEVLAVYTSQRQENPQYNALLALRDAFFESIYKEAERMLIAPAPRVGAAVAAAMDQLRREFDAMQALAVAGAPSASNQGADAALNFALDKARLDANGMIAKIGAPSAAAPQTSAPKP